jgi:hypothetical protein
MKIPLPHRRRPAGILLIECLVYFSVFAILTSIGFAAFYLCWNQSKAVVYATEDIEAALRAGERWRTDVRAASGSISIEQKPGSQTVRLRERGKIVVYRFGDGEMRREISTSQNSELLLPKVKTSLMTLETQAGVTDCRWELQLAQRRSETQLPLLFTFEAAQLKP